jgi:hypothetical protein
MMCSLTTAARPLGLRVLHGSLRGTQWVESIDGGVESNLWWRSSPFQLLFQFAWDDAILQGER